jgi:rod shape determining protein RodA
MGSGSFFPWCFNQFCRFVVGTIALLFVSAIKLKFWEKYAYPFYFLCLFLLIGVAIVGKTSMGAQRWLNLYFFNFQPSELMRIFLIIALSKYFSTRSVEDCKRLSTLCLPVVLIALPMGLVLIQPDLGTAVLLFLVFCSVLFVCGVQIWKFAFFFFGILLSMPILWNMLHDYQQKRVLTFFSPEMDPSGAGYHIIQSQIAIGAGGFWGSGFMNGSQSQLNFLPEKQTDFVFAALGEEFGFFGCLLLLLLYGLLITYNLGVVIRMKNKFEKIMVFGVNSMLFFYIFINVSMVCGLLPVVGVPLPFFSYGGSALVVLMFCEGLIFSADIEHKH